MIVVLAEKPDVAKKIAAALGGIKDGTGVIPFSRIASSGKKIGELMRKGYLETDLDGVPCRVTWAFGHLCGLKDVSDYHAEYQNWRKMPVPFFPERYEIKPNGKDAEIRLKAIRELFQEADQIICATDDDREGELIFSYIYEYTKCAKPVKRACFSSMTEEGFRKAFRSLIDGAERKPIEAAGRMRAVADWAAGINMTVAMTVRNPGSGVVHVGRVQTPTLKIVVDRELAIREFIPETFWRISAVFTKENGKTYPAEHTTERFPDSSEAEKELAYLEQHREEAAVAGIERKTVTKGAPHLYSLATLQMDANGKYHMTLKQVLDAAQSLYTKGLTTYPRTTSQYLTEDMLPTVHRVLGALRKTDAYRELIEGRSLPGFSKYWFDNTKVESHFAIIPTGQIPKGLSASEQKIYDLIAKSVIRMMYGQLKTEETAVKTKVGESVFLSKGVMVSDPGWTAVDGIPKEKRLPNLEIDERVTGTFQTQSSETKPPSRYTDKTLLSAMIMAGKLVSDEELKAILDDPKVNGIGTSATRDSIIENLIRNEYLSREKKTIYATEKGIALIGTLPVADVKSPELTAVWEKRLGDIARRTEEPDIFRRDLEQKVSDWCGTIMAMPKTDLAPKAVLPCPVCGTELKSFKWGKACKTCGFTIGKICGKSLSERQIEDLLIKGKTALIRGFTSRNGKRFDAYLNWDGNEKKIAFRFPERKRTKNHRQTGSGRTAAKRKRSGTEDERDNN